MNRGDVKIISLVITLPILIILLFIACTAMINSSYNEGLTYVSSDGLTHKYSIEKAGITFETPHGYKLEPYDRDLHDDVLKDYSAAVPQSSSESLRYVAVNSHDDILVEAIIHTSKDLPWSMSEFDKELLDRLDDKYRSYSFTEDTRDFQGYLYWNDYAFLYNYQKYDEKNDRAEFYLVREYYRALENRYQIIISAHSNREVNISDFTRNIVDSMIVNPGGPKAVVIAKLIFSWIYAIMVSASLIALYRRQRNRAVKIVKWDYDKLKGYGWIMITFIIFSILSLVLRVVIIIIGTDWSAPIGEITKDIAQKIPAIVINVIVLIQVFRKKKGLILIYTLWVVLALCFSAATKNPKAVIFASFDAPFCIYFMFSARVSKLFGFRKIEFIEEDPGKYKTTMGEFGIQFRDISIKGRIAYAIACLESAILHYGLDTESWDELLLKLWSITGMESTDDWFFEISEFLPKSVQKYDTYEQGEYDYIDEDQFNKLHTVYSEASNVVVDTVDIIFDIASRHRRGLIRNNSPKTLLMLDSLILAYREAGIPLPSYVDFEVYDLGVKRGWGVSFDGTTHSKILSIQ